MEPRPADICRIVDAPSRVAMPFEYQRTVAFEWNMRKTRSRKDLLTKYKSAIEPPLCIIYGQPYEYKTTLFSKRISHILRRGTNGFSARLKNGRQTRTIYQTPSPSPFKHTTSIDKALSSDVTGGVVGQFRTPPTTQRFAFG